MLCDSIDGFKEELGQTEGIAEATTTDKLGEVFEVRLSLYCCRHCRGERERERETP